LVYWLVGLLVGWLVGWWIGRSAIYLVRLHYRDGYMCLHITTSQSSTCSRTFFGLGRYASRRLASICQHRVACYLQSHICNILKHSVSRRPTSVCENRALCHCFSCRPIGVGTMSVAVVGLWFPASYRMAHYVWLLI
jgi:hypothetical protein